LASPIQKFALPLTQSQVVVLCIFVLVTSLCLAFSDADIELKILF